MNIGQLEALAAVVETRSITAAARQLGIDQSTATRRIQRLELDLGATLLEFDHGTFVLTAAGEQASAFASETLRALNDLQASVGQQPASLVGTVRIAASTTPGEYLVPALISSFLTQHPEVRFELDVTDSHGVAALLRTGSVHVGFCGHLQAASGFDHTGIGPDEVILAVAAGHRLAARETVGIEEIERERFIHREPGSGTERTFMDALSDAGLPFCPKGAGLIARSTSILLAAIRAGVGVGVVSSRAVEGGSPAVRPLRVAGVRAWRQLYLSLPAGGIRFPPQHAFLEHVRSQLDLPSGPGPG